jgi:hypothetical protein
MRPLEPTTAIVSLKLIAHQHRFHSQGRGSRSPSGPCAPSQFRCYQYQPFPPGRDRFRKHRVACTNRTVNTSGVFFRLSRQRTNNAPGVTPCKHLRCL